MAKLTTPEKANRLARAIASDIAAYNDAAITRALAEDSFFEAMAEELEEGRVHYDRVDENSSYVELLSACHHRCNYSAASSIRKSSLKGYRDIHEPRTPI